MSVFIEAVNTKDIAHFLKLVLPIHWQPISARILETGVEFDEGLCAWAPRWSKIPLTIRYGANELETAIKSCIFRMHDCFHQLWGLPIPGREFSDADFYLYKRSQMCGEVAVLTLTEFYFCRYLTDNFPETRSLIGKRNALPMWEGPLFFKSIEEIALRLDDILHKKSRPKWLREHAPSTAFANDYVPMLENDRENIDNNWRLMKEANWFPEGAPNSRYNQHLDGLELTKWMVDDFFHQMKTDPIVDEPLREFNRLRRSTIILPEGWNSIPLVK